MKASQMRSKDNRSVNTHRQIVRCASVKSAGASGLGESDFIPNDSDRELVASFNVDGKWLDCFVAELSYWDGDRDNSGYYVYVIDDLDGNEVASSGQDSWTSMGDAIDAAIEHCDDIAENPDGYKLSKTSQMRAKKSGAYDCNRSMNRRASASSRLGGLNPDVRRLPKTAHGRAFASKNATTSNKKAAYDYNECFDIVDDMTHETYDHLKRQQRRSNGRLTEDRLFTLAKGYIYDRLSDDQLIDLYRYFNGESVDVLNDEQAARVVEAIAYMVMDHVDEGLDEDLHMGSKKANGCNVRTERQE